MIKWSSFILLLEVRFKKNLSFDIIFRLFMVLFCNYYVFSYFFTKFLQKKTKNVLWIHMYFNNNRKHLVKNICPYKKLWLLASNTLFPWAWPYSSIDHLIYAIMGKKRINSFVKVYIHWLLQSKGNRTNK